MRGTLTNGYKWLFVVLTLNTNGDGATYSTSPCLHSVAPQDGGADMIVPEKVTDLIAEFFLLGYVSATSYIFLCAHSIRSNVAVKVLGRMIGLRWYKYEESVVLLINL